MVDREIAKEVMKIIHFHRVSDVVDYTWGAEVVPHCFTCGYFGDKEDPTLHTANVVLEYVEEYYRERFGNA